jgi:hypothetical protein
MSGVRSKPHKGSQGLAGAVPEWGCGDMSRAPKSLLAAPVVRLGPIRGQLQPMHLAARTRLCWSESKLLQLAPLGFGLDLSSRDPLQYLQAA